MEKVTYLAPRRAPRLPPIADVNQSEVMLGALVWIIVFICLAALILWRVRRG